jgi:hypothetical protein
MTARPVSDAGRARVEQALSRFGLLLIQGQWEVPSLADLIEGAPVTTRGFSWDYVPAWTLADELQARPDIFAVKLLRGRLTLVHERLWPATDALARAAMMRVGALPARHDAARFFSLVLREPGIAGGAIRERLALDAAGFQRVKSALEKRLCIFGRERDDTDHHTHESRWFPWPHSPVARATASRRAPAVEQAVATLLAAVFPERRPERLPRLTTLFPVTA